MIFNGVEYVPDDEKELEINDMLEEQDIKSVLSDIIMADSNSIYYIPKDTGNITLLYSRDDPNLSREEIQIRRVYINENIIGYINSGTSVYITMYHDEGRLYHVKNMFDIDVYMKA
jgi:hypothetical protein